MSNGDLIRCKVTSSVVFYPRNKILEDGDFIIGKFKVAESLQGEPLTDRWNCITVKGNMPAITTGTEYILLAKEVEDEQYGKQYNKIFMSENINWDSIEDQKKFLKRILSPLQVSNVFRTLKNPMRTIKEGNIEELCSVKGIGVTTALSIINKYEKCKDNGKAYVELDQYGLTTKMIDKLIGKYRSPEIVISKIRKNIYILADEVDGVGFRTVDSIALKNGLDVHDVNRVKAYIIYCLESQAQNGNSYLLQEDLMESIIDNLMEEDSDFEQLLTSTKKAIYQLKDEGLLWWDNDKTKIALSKYRKLEKNIYIELMRILNGDNELRYENWKEIVASIEKAQGWSHTTEQVNGIKEVLDNQLVLVTGLSGTGKTSITNAVTEILNKYEIKQCALAGRASQRIAEVTGREASTIHKLLGHKPPNEWAYNKKHPVYGDVFILDEASMVGGELFLKLLQAIPTGAKLIIIGDYGQLSSIGACNVFYDLLSSNAIPTIKLTTIHRQAQASAIISKSIEIREQKQIIEKDFEGEKTLGELQDLKLSIRRNKVLLPSLIEENFKKALLKFNDIMDVQVIVPMTKRGDISTYMLNKRLQKIYNNNTETMTGREKIIDKDKKYTIYQGDKVINTKNNYKTVNNDGEKTPIFNGSVGIVKEYNEEADTMIVVFDGIGDIVLNGGMIDNLELSYAITCNKFQGSQTKCVIVGLDYSAYLLLTCEWVYTAITRAEEFAMLIAENKALRYATNNVETIKKQTFLANSLNNENK